MIHSYLDIIERSLTGPQVEKDEWDLEHIVMNTRKLVDKYDLSWDKGEIVLDDPKLVDSVFQAGLELIGTVGVYCLSTERVIAFEPEELEEGMRAMPQALVMGEGIDERTLYSRKIMDPRLPIVWAGNPGAPTPEDIFLPNVMSWMQEPIVDLITCGSLPQVDGHNVGTGKPTEILAARRQQPSGYYRG